jgi:ABC-type transport system involved in Fe-S cluster assembly fused permease/ATPase subunit
MKKYAEIQQDISLRCSPVCKRRIGIVISPRFSTVRIADRIAVIVEGNIKELGTHHELLAAGNTYAMLF